MSDTGVAPRIAILLKWVTIEAITTSKAKTSCIAIEIKSVFTRIVEDVAFSDALRRGLREWHLGYRYWH